MFKTFARFFGAKWQLLFEDRPARAVWFRSFEVEGVTDNDLRLGLKACVKLDWPPSIGEFIKLCAEDQTRRHASHQFYKALPRPQGDKILQQSAINQMKIFLGSVQ